MTAQEYKSLTAAGISESAVMILSDILDRKKEKHATKEDLRMTELRLQKEMEEINFSITLRMMFFFNPIYIALIMYIVKSFLGA
ncbi:MAG: hypothetical protein GDA51_08765 [Ekhidna sp.]|nr:hypothetical protein [Ekhidna sp.]MBC6426541.1 hypothetical protein [Ekhidna sp.]